MGHSEKVDSASVETVYSAYVAREAQNPLALYIENEYLYWTNKVGTKEGAVHKAFTEPFIKAIPF
jgi:hypothetical protein